MISQVRRILLALKPVSSVVKVSEGSSVLANVTYAESMVIMSCPIRDRQRYLRGTAYTPIRHLRLNYLRFERRYGATCGVSLIVKVSWLTSSDHCIPVVGLSLRNNRNVGSSYTTLPCFRLGGTSPRSTENQQQRRALPSHKRLSFASYRLPRLVGRCRQ